jgi:hypothetical protein
MHNEGIRAVRPHGTNQGLVQVLGKGLVRTVLWAVRSTGRWSGAVGRAAAAALDLLARRHNAYKEQGRTLNRAHFWTHARFDKRTFAVLTC